LGPGTVPRAGRIGIVADNELPPPPPENESSGPALAIPDRFVLEQNYPNPFNPTTILTFAIGRESLVSLKVYDVLGREIKTIVHGIQSAGSQSVTWDATDVPSGVYFYRLQAGEFVETKKMLLMR